MRQAPCSGKCKPRIPSEPPPRNRTQKTFLEVHRSLLSPRRGRDGLLPSRAQDGPKKVEAPALERFGFRVTQSSPQANEASQAENPPENPPPPSVSRSPCPLKPLKSPVQPVNALKTPRPFPLCRFTQASISPSFRDGRPIFQLMNDLNSQEATLFWQASSSPYSPPTFPLLSPYFPPTFPRLSPYSPPPPPPPPPPRPRKATLATGRPSSRARALGCGVARGVPLGFCFEKLAEDFTFVSCCRGFVAGGNSPSGGRVVGGLRQSWFQGKFQSKSPGCSRDSRGSSHRGGGGGAGGGGY